MSQDARFEDVSPDRPLRLVAVDAEDLKVIAAVTQDAVFPITEMRWDAHSRRFALLLNRFRWEDMDAAKRQGRPYERVQSLLVFNDVSRVRSQGIDRSDRSLVLSLLDISFAETDPPAGTITLTLAGDGAIALDADCLDASLRDVTRPYVAPSGKAPSHP